MSKKDLEEVMKRIAEGKKDKFPGGIRKIADRDTWTRKLCRHPSHNFPNMICLPPGTYEHTCPGCGATQIVHVDPVMMSAKQNDWGCQIGSERVNIAGYGNKWGAKKIGTNVLRTSKYA